jgi:hypothetical protein
LLDRDSQYTVRLLTDAITKDVEYLVKTSHSDTLSSEYDVALVGSVDLNSLYTVKRENQYTTDIAYHIQYTNSFMEDSEYTVQRVYTYTLDIEYSVIVVSDHTIPINSQYVVIFGTTLEYDIQYCVPSTQQFTKNSTYEVISGYGTVEIPVTYMVTQFGYRSRIMKTKARGGGEVHHTFYSWWGRSTK